MFSKNSRYYNIETARFKVSDEKTIPYVRRRILPASSDLDVQAQHVVMQGERLDIIAAKYGLDPEQFWKICDINDAMMPFELTDEKNIGQRLKIPSL
jgi:hypothetical protein